MVLRKLGLYCSERLSIDYYYLIEAINLIIPDIGENYIKEKYKAQGKNWDEMKKKLDTINKQVSKAKVFYDALEDKTMKKIVKDNQEKNNPEKIIQRFFIKNVSKVALMQGELLGLFIFLTKISTLQRKSINNESFKILEHSGFRKIDLSKRPHQQSSGITIGEGS